MTVTYEDHMGSDLTVVNNAKVSFGKRSEWVWDEDTGTFSLAKADKGLIAFLARGVPKGDWEDLKKHMFGGDEDMEGFEHLMFYLKNMPTHWTPFANGCQIKFHFKVPFPIARQIFKHKVGSVENEISRRYVSDRPEMFMPEFRKEAPNRKQGSLNEPVYPSAMWSDGVLHTPLTMYELMGDYYEHLIDQGVCAEQARMFLPQGAMTEFIMTNSLYGWANFFNQRSDVQHAQREVAYVAHEVAAVCERLFPVSWKELTK